MFSASALARTTPRLHCVFLSSPTVVLKIMPENVLPATSRCLEVKELGQIGRWTVKNSFHPNANEKEATDTKKIKYHEPCPEGIH
jgi:hypothetical protein